MNLTFIWLGFWNLHMSSVVHAAVGGQTINIKRNRSKVYYPRASQLVSSLSSHKGHIKPLLSNLAPALKPESDCLVPAFASFVLWVQLLCLTVFYYWTCSTREFKWLNGLILQLQELGCRVLLQHTLCKGLCWSFHVTPTLESTRCAPKVTSLSRSQREDRPRELPQLSSGRSAWHVRKVLTWGV